MRALGQILIVGLVLSASCSTPKRETASGDKKWFEKTNIFYARLLNFNKKTAATPLETFEELRLEKPVLKLSKLPILFPEHDIGKTYFIAKRVDVLEVLTKPSVFSVRLYSNKIEKTIGPHMLASDNKSYNLVEKPWMRSLLPPQDFPRVKKLSFELAQRSVQEVIDQQPNAKRIRIEMVNDLARKVPMLLSGEYFGFPGPDLKTMYRWSYVGQEQFFHNIFNSPIITKKAHKMGAEIIQYTKRLISQKRKALAESKHPEDMDDILSRMIKSGVPEALTDQTSRIEYNVIGMVIASGETTQTAAVNAMDEILKRPDVFEMAKKAALDNDDKLLEKIIFEALRFNPQTPMIVRYTEKETSLSGVVIPAGSVILVGTQSAMFDEDQVKNPEKFDVTRDDEIYLHFGYGHHKCLGDYLGRAMVTQIIKSLLILPHLARAEGASGTVNSDKSPYPESFVLEFDRAQ